jgi:hypothetical protein
LPEHPLEKPVIQDAQQDGKDQEQQFAQVQVEASGLYPQDCWLYRMRPAWVSGMAEMLIGRLGGDRIKKKTLYLQGLIVSRLVHSL